MVAAWRLYGRTGAACCAATREPAFGVASPGSIVHTVRQPRAHEVPRIRERLFRWASFAGRVHWFRYNRDITEQKRIAPNHCWRRAVGCGNFRREVNVAFAPNSDMDLAGGIAAERQRERCPNPPQEAEESK